MSNSKPTPNPSQIGSSLSPAAQAILEAHDIGFSTPRLCLAAALRAAADQVVHNRVCRMELHLIAEELEGQ